jgi:hypothetical protein
MPFEGCIITEMLALNFMTTMNRVARRPGFRGTSRDSRIQASVSRVPAEPFQGRELSRIWSIASLIINFLFSAVQHRLIIRH